MSYRNSIKITYENAEKTARILLNEEIRLMFERIKTDNAWIDKINLVSGMGTVVFKVNGQFVDGDKQFTEVRELCEDMAGDYNLYPDDIEV